MIRINKNLATFITLTILLEFVILFALQKLTPFLTHTVYYCQSFITSLSIPIPYFFGTVPFFALSVLLGAASVRFFITILKAELLKKKLSRNITLQKSLNRLLRKLQLNNKTLLVEDSKPFAFCLGIRRPKIYISTSMVALMSEQELEAILRHENYHLKNKDTLILLIASIGESLLPFFPLFSDLMHNYRIEREIKADREAIHGLGKSEPIISVLKKLLICPSSAMATVAAVADHDTLEPRIKALLKHDMYFRTFKIKRMIISLFSILALSLVVLSPVHAVDLQYEKNDIMMLCPYGDSCAKWCTDNKTIAPQYSSMPQSSLENVSHSYSTMHK